MPKEGLPPRDSWTFIPKGRQVVIDIQEVRSAQNELTTYFHQVRGNLIAAAYDLERIVDQLLLLSFVPAELHNKGPQAGLFDEFILKGRFMSFASKIEILKKIRTEIVIIQDFIDSELVRKLDDARKIRNLFAHYPITFHMDGEEPIRMVKPVLVTRKEEIEMTNEKIGEYYALINNVRKELEEALRQINGKKPDDTQSIQPSV